MANHKSSIKRIRSTEAKKLRNRYHAKTMRNAIKEIKNETDSKAAATKLPKVVAMIDKLAKKNVIHKNKAANLKSKLAKKVSATAKTTPKAAKPKTAKKK